MSKKAQEVFGRKADFYVTSPAHADAQNLSPMIVLVQPFRDMLALDVATGGGHTAFALAPSVGEVVACDLTMVMLKKARTEAAIRGLERISFVAADASCLPFPDEIFDTVTCRRAAHHFEDIASALQEMRRVLKVGGRLVIEDRSVPLDPYVDATMNHLDALHDRSHVREYNQEVWRAMLETAGFQVLSIKPFTRVRPLSSLTDTAAPEDAREVERTVGIMSAEQRQRMGISDGAEGVKVTHWLVMVLALK